MNRIVIAAHGCPVGCLGPYGNEWVGTPNLDRLAAEGVVFDRHFARTPDPLAARRDWWADVRNGVLVRASRPAFDAPADYYAAWGEVFEARPDPVDASPWDALFHVLPKALDRMQSQPDALLWIETDVLLPPWDAPQDVFEAYLEELTDEDDPEAGGEPVEPWRNPPVGWFDRDDFASWELLHRTFAAAVTSFDADLGRLFERLRDRGLDRTATWAFTSDFGYPLGEHGIVGPHRPWLHVEFVHLPLIVRLPNAEQAGRRTAGFTQPADLTAILNGQFDTGRADAVSEWAVNGGREASLRTDTHALLLPLEVPDGDDPRPPLLYEKPDDRWEANDVRQPNAEVADELAARLKSRLPHDDRR